MKKIQGSGYKYIIFFVIIISLIILVTHPRGDRNNPAALAPNQIDPFFKSEIRKKIDILFLKHDLTSLACKDDLLEFYFYQNSNYALDGDVPYPEMTSEIIKTIAQKHGCPTSDLAAIVSDYEAWVLVEEQRYRDEDPGVLNAEMGRDEF